MSDRGEMRRYLRKRRVVHVPFDARVEYLASIPWISI
jgi:hypothetical protein